MSETDLLKIFKNISKEVSLNLAINENELYGILDKSGFFQILGYQQIGKDIRKQYKVDKAKKIADYICLDDFHNIIFVIEAKKPLDNQIENYIGDLWDKYVIPLKSKYGILTNGITFIVYSRLSDLTSEKIFEFELDSVDSNICSKLSMVLNKPIYDILNIEKIRDYFNNVESMYLTNETAKEYFYETYQLNKDSIFGYLVKDMLKLFDYSYDKSSFLQEVYDFWKKSLATKPEEIPESWKSFIKEKEEPYKLMFILETTHSFVGRMIIAKACQDLNFPMINISNYILNHIEQVRENIPPLGYPLVTIKLIKEMRDQLIYSIFEEDIFSWWEDIFNNYKNKTSAELIKEQINEELYNFSITLGRFILILYKFNFKEIAGDPLGDLYQRYFDRETRRALGEFYTPVEIVDYILDEVNYVNVKEKRLIDPACGSGTFLVMALKRYLKEVEFEAHKSGWTTILKELCNKPKIIGLDIHPFACLMAQIRFMIELMPYYKIAIEEEKMTVLESLQRLPIFRTDSLIKEMIPPEISKKPTFQVTGEDIKFTLDLPIINEKTYEQINIIIPSWRKVVNDVGTDVYNLDEYFCLIQAIFDSIKNIYKLDENEIPSKNLENQIKKYLTNRDYYLLSNYFKKYGDNILSEIRRIRKPSENGRILKTIEDSILASFLKNYMKYDFVVGNPPYVKTQTFSVNKPYLKRIYKDTVYKNFDLYIPFIQRGIEWINSGGKFSFIVSNMFINRDYGEKLRSFILKNCDILEILNFRACQVFKEVTNYACIFVFTSKSDNENQLRYIRVGNKKDDLLDYIKNHKNEEYFDDYIDVFTYSQKSLSEKAWTIMPKKEYSIYNKIKKSNSHLLKSLVHSDLGIKEASRTGENSVYIVPRETVSKYNIEKDLVVPKIKGANEIKRWHINWDGEYILLPYTENKGSFIPIEIEKYPNFELYMNKFRTKLEKRRLFGKTILQHNKKWYEIWNPLPYKTLKIVYPEISKSNSFALDTDNYYCVGKNFIIYLNSNKIEDYFVLLGILNSTTLEYYFKQTASVKRGNYYEFMGNVELLPIIKLLDDSKQLIVNKVKQILEHNLPLFETYFIESLSKITNSPIEFYELSVNRNIVKDINVKIIDNLFMIYLNSNNHLINVSSNEEVDYILTLINDSENEKIKIPRPSSLIISHLNEIKQSYENIKSIDVIKLEHELNQIISKLYNLDDEEIDIINKFIIKY